VALGLVSVAQLPWRILAAQNAQRCHLLRTSEQHFGRSAREWAGSGQAKQSLRIWRLGV